MKHNELRPKLILTQIGTNDELSYVLTLSSPAIFTKVLQKAFQKNVLLKIYKHKYIR